MATMATIVDGDQLPPSTAAHTTTTTTTHTTTTSVIVGMPLTDLQQVRALIRWYAATYSRSVTDVETEVRHQVDTKQFKSK